MIRAYTDGACRVSNPGYCSCAWAIELPYGRVAKGYYLGPELHSNNYAEYHGLLYLLRHLYEKKYTDVLIHCDSVLVVNQVNGEWETWRKPELEKFAHEAYGLLTAGHHRLIHVRGHGKNAHATDNEGNDYVDKLCNQVLDEHRGDYDGNKTKSV